jgi:hypothetical protein
MKERFDMSRTGSVALFGLALAALTLVSAPEAQAQGCVASRMNAPSGCHDAKDTDGTSYYLPEGRWQSSFGYRWFRSHRHFVGSIEQNGKPPAERDRSGTEVINHTHLPSLSLSYGITNRLSFSADLPVLIARRKSPANATRPLQRTDARGIGDLNLMGRYWIGDPTGSAPQNLSFGAGFKLPTGNERLEDDVLVMNTTTRVLEPVRRPVDQSIQPGDGGFGFLAELQAFKAVGPTTLFASGSYLLNPKGTNGVPTNRGRATEAIMSVADQYAARIGVGMAAPFNRKIGLSLAARLEGVPVEDLVGGSDGFRRPGYSIGLEPGVSYSWKKNAVSLSVPYFVRRVRNQNTSDLLESERTGNHVQGDAAFADYMIVFGFSRRF